MAHDEEWKRKWKKIEIEHNIPTKWNWMVAYPENLNLGKYVDIGAFTYINAKNCVTIDDDVQIGSHVAIYTENTIDGTFGHVWLEKGCSIGSHSIIMPGVTIGYKAIVGAFSLVKEDIPAGATAVGIPARQIHPII